MQAGVRDWVRRTAAHGEKKLRSTSPNMLLSVVCASAVGPVVVGGAGVTSAAAVAGAGVISSVGGGVLSAVIAGALDRMREREKADTPSPVELEAHLAEQIQEILDTGQADAKTLRAEIAAVLEAIDAGGTALRAAIEVGSDQVRRDVIAVFGELGADFDELRFLLGSVERAAAEILAGQDAQGAQLRAIINKVGWAGTEARLAREEAAAWRTRTAGRASGKEPGQGARWAGGCPYRGLLPFTEAEADMFYGRERLTAELAGRLSEPSAEMIIVTGASGAGKSSLLRAGLLPALARGLQVPGSQDWPRIVMTPSRQPLAELAAHLAALGGTSAAAVLEDLSSNPEQAHLAAWQAVITATRHGREQAAGGTNARLVLIVDQFEEVFTPDRDGIWEQERRAFITALHAASTRPVGPHCKPPALVILAVRGDYWDRCAAYPELGGALQDSHLVVGPMTEIELRLAITGPAKAAGLRIDAALTDVILSDLRSASMTVGAGALPLLSQAMLATWENRDGDELTSHGYSLAGGISFAVQTSADAVYDALPASHRALAREVLTSMSAVGSDGRLTSRAVTRSSLYSRRPAAECARIDEILDAFAARRLLVLNDGGAEMAHDALLRGWPRLRGWLEEDRASWMLHTQLAEDAATWRGHGDDPSFLYRGTQFAAVSRAADGWSADPGRYPAITSTERDFLHAADRAAARASRWRRAVVVVVVVLFLASLAGAGIAIVKARAARQQTALAISGEIAAQSETFDTTGPVTASLLATAAWRIDPGNPLARESLLDAYAQPYRETLNLGSPYAFAGAFSANGKVAVTIGNDASTVQLWNRTTREQIGLPITVPGNAQVWVVALSADGRLLATADNDGTTRLWDVATHKQIGAAIVTKNNLVLALAFSADGTRLATAQGYGTFRLWDVATHREIGGPLTSPVPTDVWAGPEPPTYIGIAFSPSGSILATADSDGAVRFWDVATHKQIGAPMALPGDNVPGLAFSPDGAMLATADSDGVVRLWDAATRSQIGAPMVTGVDETNNYLAVAFSPDGTTLASMDGNTIQLWDVGMLNEIGAPITVPGSLNSLAGVNGVAYSPDRRLLVTADGNGTVDLWDVTTHRQIGMPITADPGSLKSFDGGVRGVAFSPDGRLLATADGDGTVKLWDVATRRQIGATITVPGDGNAIALPGSSSVLGVAFSPDGRLLATADGPRQVLLWDVNTHQRIGTLITHLNSGVLGVAFSPDGTMLATASSDGTVRLWDAATLQQVGASINVPGSSSPLGVAFSPDGTMLATADGDGTVRLWDVATLAQIGPSINVPGYNDVNGVAFSPDGTMLATADGDSTVRLWDVAFPHNLLNAVCAIAGGSLNRQEWEADIQAEPFQKACP